MGRVICLLGDKAVYLMTMNLILCLYVCFVVIQDAVYIYVMLPDAQRLSVSNLPIRLGGRKDFFSVQLLINASHTSLSLKRIW